MTHIFLDWRTSLKKLNFIKLNVSRIISSHFVRFVKMILIDEPCATSDEPRNNLSLATAITRSRYSSRRLVYVTQRKPRSQDGKECAPIVFHDSRVQNRLHKTWHPHVLADVLTSVARRESLT